MRYDLQRLTDVWDHEFDMIIDVRSPSEFAHDRIPGAINLPVLSDAERAHVGTIYKQVAPFEARKIGAALVFRNAADHIETKLSDKDGGWRPLVYCWRGGQRSGAFAWVLREIGWRAETVVGGYQAYRRLVVDQLYDTPLPFKFVQIGGYTGTAKTELLERLNDRGIQTLNLEALAQHRGSLLGAMPVPQPSQKGFDTAIAAALARLDPARPVVVEAESSKIGRVLIPPAVWAAMKDAPWVIIEAPIAERARYLETAYAAILQDRPNLRAQLSLLKRFRGAQTVARWMSFIDAGDNAALCAALIRDHYDPAYDKAAKAQQPTVLERLHCERLDDAALNQTADVLAKVIQKSSI